MKRALAVFITLSLNIFLISPTYANPIPGKSCYKEGAKEFYKGLTYTCLKYGDKLLWNKGIKLRINTTSVEVNDTKPPKELIANQKILESFIAKYKTQKIETKYSIEFEPVLSGTKYQKDFSDSLQVGLKILDSLPFRSRHPLSIFIGWNSKWLDEKAAILSPGCSVGTCPGQTKDCKTVVCGDIPTYLFINAKSDLPLNFTEYPSDYWEIGVRGAIPHELGHIALYRSYENLNSNKWGATPQWLKEGWSEYVKVIAYAIYKNISFTKAHVAYVQNGACTQYPIKTFNKLGGSDSKYRGCDRSAGLLATEYLFANIKDYAAIFRVGTKSTNRNSIDLYEVTGIPFDKFAVGADNYIKKAGLPQKWWETT